METNAVSFVHGLQLVAAVASLAAVLLQVFHS